MEIANSNPVFGPVPSRRLGISLGVDLVPMKVCSYDCIYCELGKTTLSTLERKEYIPEHVVIESLEHYFSGPSANDLDYVTFSGSGEPTLHSSIGTFIRKVKTLTETPVAVLTNGSLLFDPQVRSDLMQADLVVPSLDAVSPDVFDKVNKPATGLEVTKVIEGIHRFCKEFKGETWLEIVLVKGVNDHPDHLDRLAEIASRMKPDKIQLSTVVRPPGVGHAPPVSSESLHEISKRFSGNIEVVSALERRENPAYRKNKGIEIVAMLKIRPMTLDEISSSTGMHHNEVVKYLDQLRKDHYVKSDLFSGQTYFTLDRESES